MARAKISTFLATLVVLAAIVSKIDASGSKNSDPWPKLLLLEKITNNFNDKTQLSTYNPETEEQRVLKAFKDGDIARPSSLTGAADTSCYALAAPPFLECLKDASPWTPVMYFRNRRDQVRRSVHKPRLELDDFGERLMYLDAGESKLHLIFLNKDNDRVALLPDEEFETFAMDWNRGVLATVDKNSQLVLWAFDDSGVPTQMANFTVEQEAGHGFVLTCDTSSSTFYVVKSDGYLWYIRYAELGAARPLELKFLNLAANVPKATEYNFVHKSFLYFLASKGDEDTRQEICRVKHTGSKSIECRPLPQNAGSTYLEIAEYRETTVGRDECDVCSHRCFPKFPRGVTCGCPFSHYGVKVDSKNKCTSEKTVAAVLTQNSDQATPVVRLVNYFNQETKLVDLEAVTGKRGIQPIGIVPLWTSHDPERFCIQSRLSEELIITCHSYKNVKSFTQVPWKAPKTKLTVLAVTHLNDVNSSWIVTWLENNEITLSGCIRYQKSGTSEILTLYCHFSQNDGLWGYTDLQMDAAFLTVDPLKHRIGYLEAEENELIHVMRTSDGETFGRFPSTMEPFRNSMSLRMNFITSFGNRGLTYTTKVKSQTLRMDKPSSSDVVNSRKLFVLVGGNDYCWVESRKNSSEFICQPEQPTSQELRWDNIVCTRTTENQAEDTVVFNFGPHEKVLSFDAAILNREQHKNKTSNACTTGNHKCSHLCIPLAGNTRNRYKCACPDEYPILLEGHKCSLRLLVDVVTPNASTSAVRITEKVASLMHTGERAFQYTFVSGQLCHIESQGIVCDNKVIPGTSGATHIIKGHNQLQDEIYWLKPSTVTTGNQCVFLSAPGKNKTMRLRCAPFSKIDGHVTVDAEQKILFWFTQNPNQTELPLLNRKKVSVTESKISVSKMPTEDLKYDMLQSIACDESAQKVFAAFYDPADRNSHIYEISYKIDESGEIPITITRFFGDFPHQITAIAGVKGNLFWFDKFSGWIYGKRPNSNRALKIQQIDETFLGQSVADLNVTSIASGYTLAEIGIKSICKDSNCEYFCERVDTPSGPALQCLCPGDAKDVANQSFIKKCPEGASDFYKALQALDVLSHP